MDFGDLQELQASYRNEAADLLTDLGASLLLLEQDSRNMEVINRVFRAMHTLKGSGASAGFRRLANFVHHVEDVFNRIRNKQLETTPELIDAALKACDCCAMLIELGSTESDVLLPLETEVLAAIRPLLPHVDEAVSKQKTVAVASGGPVRYAIGFRPHREIFFSGTDPATLLLELADLGKSTVVCDTTALLGIEEFDPEQCYLDWKIVLETVQPLASVRGVFQFVEDECEVSIEAMPKEPSTPRTDARTLRFESAAEQCFTALGFAMEQIRTDPSGNSSSKKQGLSTASRAAQTLVFASKAHGHAAATTAAHQILDLVTAVQQASGAAEGTLLDGQDWLEKLSGLVLEAREAVKAPVLAEAERASLEHAVEGVPAVAAMRATDVLPEAAQSIRVDAVKLDALMRLAGELLVARGALPAFAERVERQERTFPDAHAENGEADKREAAKTLAKEMRDAGAKVSRLADDLQATVMSIRMMPVRQVFQRFPRLVRDIARSLDKNIELIVAGEETELDKTVIESIGDPLTHIIRNAADHGIESKADRLARGKTAVGRIELSAYTRGSNVTIEVRDDGKGLDPARLKRRAVEKGLYSEAAVAAMDEEAAFKIILAAGFSTVDKVTDLSGRGVGMDVVRNSVEALRGVIHISSEVGKGTRFRIELPASLLVSKGILVSSRGHQVVLPMETIRHMVKLPRSDFRRVQGQQIAAVRGTVFPMLSLAQALSFSDGRGGMDDEGESREEAAVAIIEAASGSYGLVVDRFVGEAEVVIKPLTGVLASVAEFVGAAIMGDGKTVLVVNTERLFTLQQLQPRLCVA
jgi:two-component system chemotaxis sensor kinase CheA